MFFAKHSEIQSTPIPASLSIPNSEVCTCADKSPLRRDLEHAADYLTSLSIRHAVSIVASSSSSGTSISAVETVTKGGAADV